MRRLVPVLALSLAACGPGVYTRAEVVYAEPVQYVYVAPAERVVVVTREVLVRRGYVVYRVEQAGPNRVIWARRGDDERSEERRVGKECRSRWAGEHEKDRGRTEG